MTTSIEKFCTDGSIAARHKSQQFDANYYTYIIVDTVFSFVKDESSTDYKEVQRTVGDALAFAFEQTSLLCEIYYNYNVSHSELVYDPLVGLTNDFTQVPTYMTGSLNVNNSKITNNAKLAQYEAIMQYAYCDKVTNEKGVIRAPTISSCTETSSRLKHITKT